MQRCSQKKTNTGGRERECQVAEELDWEERWVALEEEQAGHGKRADKRHNADRRRGCGLARWSQAYEHDTGDEEDKRAKRSLNRRDVGVSANVHECRETLALKREHENAQAETGRKPRPCQRARLSDRHAMRGAC